MDADHIGPLVPFFELQGHTNTVSCIAFSRDLRLVATGSWDKTVLIHDLHNGQPLMRLTGHTDWVLGVAFSPDCRLVASCGLDEIGRVWDVDTGALLQTLEGHDGNINKVIWSVDGALLAMGSSDATIRIYRTADWTLQHNLAAPQSSHICSIAFSEDASRLVSGSIDGVARVWDLTDKGKIIAKFDGHKSEVQMVAFTSGGVNVVTVGRDAMVRVWDWRSQRELRSFAVNQVSLWTAVLTPNEGRVVVGDYNKKNSSVRMYDMTNGREVAAIDPCCSEIESVAVSPDRHWIAAAGTSQVVRVWKTEDIVRRGLDIAAISAVALQPTPGRGGKARADHAEQPATPDTPKAGATKTKKKKKKNPAVPPVHEPFPHDMDDGGEGGGPVDSPAPHDVVDHLLQRITELELKLFDLQDANNEKSSMIRQHEKRLRAMQSDLDLSKLQADAASFEQTVLLQQLTSTNERLRQQNTELERKVREASDLLADKDAQLQLVQAELTATQETASAKEDQDRVHLADLQEILREQSALAEKRDRQLRRLESKLNAAHERIVDISLGPTPTALHDRKNHVYTWTIEEVMEWLKREGFGADVISVLREQHTDGSVLFELTHERLTEMGITLVGDRLRLLGRIRHLTPQPSASSLVPPAPTLSSPSPSAPTLLPRQISPASSSTALLTTPSVPTLGGGGYRQPPSPSVLTSVPEEASLSLSDLPAPSVTAGMYLPPASSVVVGGSVPERTSSPPLEVNASEIQLGPVLERGEQGSEICSGSYNGMHVIIHRRAESEQLVDEARVMRSVGPHPNVVQQYGICQTMAGVQLVMEFCDKGNLELYLRANQHAPEPLLLQLIGDVAKGMAHLSQFMVHRKLVARSILLSSSGPPFFLRAKVGSFDEARRLRNPMPLDNAPHDDRQRHLACWKPPEVVKQLEREREPHTVASDVWMFATLVWEVFALVSAESPELPVKPTPRSDYFPPLDKPRRCPAMLYRLMSLCWNGSPNQRPDFRRIIAALQEIASTSE